MFENNETNSHEIVAYLLLEQIPSISYGFDVSQDTFGHALVFNQFIAELFDFVQSLFGMVSYAIFEILKYTRNKNLNRIFQ